MSFNFYVFSTEIIECSDVVWQLVFGKGINKRMKLHLELNEDEFLLSIFLEKDTLLRYQQCRTCISKYDFK